MLFAYLIVNLLSENLILLLGGGEEQADEVSVCSADEAEGLVEGRRGGHFITEMKIVQFLHQNRKS